MKGFTLRRKNSPEGILGRESNACFTSNSLPAR
jgi:hypothetical protein